MSRDSRVFLGTPQTAKVGVLIEPATDTTRSTRVYNSRAPHHSEASFEAWFRIPENIVGQGERTCTVADTAYPLTVSSLNCVLVQLFNAGSGTGVWGNYLLTTAGGYIPRVGQGTLWVPITDVITIHVASSTAGDIIKWVALGW